MSLGPEVEAVLSDTRPSRGYDASVALCFSPESIPVEMAEPLARVWDESERAKNAFAVLVPGRNPFHVANNCLLYTSPSPRDATLSRMPSSA